MSFVDSQEVSQKSIIIKDYTIIIELPDTQKDIRYSKDNNVFCFKAGKRVWEIKDLLIQYSKEKQLKYYREMYFDIIDIGEGKLKCIGFYNHCIIDVYQEKIISIMNNK